LHAYFIWIGDILYFHGVVWLLLFPLRKARAVALPADGVLSLLVASSIWLRNFRFGTTPPP
jgi:uncharacterized membrane protein YeiB